MTQFNAQSVNQNSLACVIQKAPNFKAIYDNGMEIIKCFGPAGGASSMSVVDAKAYFESRLAEAKKIGDGHLIKLFTDLLASLTQVGSMLPELISIIDFIRKLFPATPPTA